MFTCLCAHQVPSSVIYRAQILIMIQLTKSPDLLSIEAMAQQSFSASYEYMMYTSDFMRFYYFSLCRGSSDQPCPTGRNTVVGTNWMDSQEWNSHHDIPRSIHGKTQENRYQKLDCMLQLLDSYQLLHTTHCYPIIITNLVVTCTCYDLFKLILI